MSKHHHQHHPTCSRPRAALMLCTCLLRGLILGIAFHPKTPLRLMCAMTFDFLYTTRNRKHLPRDRYKTLLDMLELGASINTFFDQKGFDVSRYRAARSDLTARGMGPLINAYLGQLQAIERTRPALSENPEQHQRIQAYREDVIRLSLDVVTTIAFNTGSLETGPPLLGQHPDFDITFKIVMLCQIIDDVIDYPKDRDGNLPSFTTATKPLSTSLQLTRQSASTYANTHSLSGQRASTALTFALHATWLIAKVLIALKKT